MRTLDCPEHRLLLLDLISRHYLGCDTGDLQMATDMMRPDVRFTLPPLGQEFTGREQTIAGLRDVIAKLPAMMRHRPAGLRFSARDGSHLRAEFTTHIMSCVDGQVFAIGDIVVDAIPQDDVLVVTHWQVSPIYFRGLIRAGRLTWFPRLLLRLVPFLLPADVRALFRAAAGGA